MALREYAEKQEMETPTPKETEENRPRLYIRFIEKGENRTLGPFWTISPSGCGLVIGQNWLGYEVQAGRFGGMRERITVPKYHYIFAK